MNRYEIEQPPPPPPVDNQGFWSVLETNGSGDAVIDAINLNLT